MAKDGASRFIDLSVDSDFKRGIFNAIIAPRPIGWISTVDRKGRANLAPYSYFNIVSSFPPILAFSCNTPEDRAEKDTLTNVRATREFVHNMASLDLIEAVNASSTPLESGEDEFAFAGLRKAPSVHVAPPRVADSPANLECRVLRILRLGGGEGEIPAHVTFGQVVGVHLKEEFLEPSGYFKTELARPVARLGGIKYAVSDTPFELERRFRQAQENTY
ncbi:MAG TPA: flavin reductase family protein [Croceibacterium sp.]|nr:flavin reductase family protein [Croceibacterium sp.]